MNLPLFSVTSLVFFAIAPDVFANDVRSVRNVNSVRVSSENNKKFLVVTGSESLKVRISERSDEVTEDRCIKAAYLALSLNGTFTIEMTGSSASYQTIEEMNKRGNLLSDALRSNVLSVSCNVERSSIPGLK